jgi:CRISPR-associated endoribonuclease Cas6
MKFYELTITCFILKDINFKESQSKLANAMNSILLNDNELILLHQSKQINKYVFSSFYPTEKYGVHKKGRIYIFKVRVFNHETIEKLRHQLSNFKNEDFKVLNTEIKTFNQHYISQLYTITPTVLTYKTDEYKNGRKNWILGDNIDILEKRINSNLVKKYNKSFTS